jgi:hypothetical protein
LIVLVMLGEDYKLLSSSISNLLQPPLTPSLFSPNTFLSQCSSFNIIDMVNRTQRIQIGTYSIYK